MTGEFDLIRRFFLPLATTPGALQLSDDAALLSVDGDQELVVTTDTIVESVHYLATDPVDSVAGKLLGVNLSDLAAMGAEPLAYLLAIALPRAWSADQSEAWLTAFARGLAAMQRHFCLGLLGGDTVASPGGACLTATAFGCVPKGRALRRSGAVVGDLVFVSGSIGDAALGLRVLSAGGLPGMDTAAAAELVDRYRWPRPRTTLGWRLLGLASAAADVSDGLVADLGHICRASGVRAVIEVTRVPVSAAARQALDICPELLNQVLCGGDDYELVFTAPVSRLPEIERAAGEANVGVTYIGSITAGDAQTTTLPVRVVNGEADVVVDSGGYEHFSRQPDK